MWRNLRATLTVWRANLWAGSTILEAEVVSGRVLRIPGQFPAGEKWLLLRAFRKLRREGWFVRKFVRKQSPKTAGLPR